jgi:hypothetical protein
VRPVDRLLERLNGVRQVGPDKWRAKCPGHDSRSLTLSIADRDGRVLLHCFAGCATDAVLSTVGLTFSDLYEKPLGEFKPLARSPFRADDVLDLITREATTLAVIASDASQERQFSPLALERLIKAASRLNHLQSVVRDVR